MKHARLQKPQIRHTSSRERLLSFAGFRLMLRMLLALHKLSWLFYVWPPLVIGLMSLIFRLHLECQ